MNLPFEWVSSCLRIQSDDFAQSTPCLFAAAAAAKAAFAKPTASPFGKAKAPLGAASPFVPTRERPFKEFNEPRGLSPDMEMAPLEDEAWWKNISLTQVVRS